MFFSRVCILSVAVLLASVSTVRAQAMKLTMPTENELNRLGLTMSWWAQAGVNPSRDSVEFFIADEQNVFVQSTTGIVTSIHAELGRKLWSHLIGRPDQQSYQATTSDREVLVSIGLHLYSLEKDTGRTVWELEMTEYPSTSPSTDDQYIFAASVDGSVFAYDQDEVRKLYQRGMLPQWTVRSRLWNFQASDWIVSPPIPMGKNVIFASEKGVVYSLNSADKQLKYQMEVGNKILTPLGYSKDRLFVTDQNARLLCVNADTGSVTWTFSGGTAIKDQPRAVGPYVYVVPHRQGLTCITVNGGVVKWQQKLATSFIAASETRVYASGGNGILLVLDRETGAMIGSLSLRSFPIAVSNDRTDRIYLCSSTGTIMALREVGSEFPNYHLYPERRPILPEFATEDEEGAEEETQ